MFQQAMEFAFNRPASLAGLMTPTGTQTAGVFS